MKHPSNYIREVNTNQWIGITGLINGAKVLAASKITVYAELPALACVVMAYSRKVYFLIPEYGGEICTCLVDNISLWLAISSCVNMWLASVSKSLNI